jgi:hypothetical protein
MKGGAYRGHRAALDLVPRALAHIVRPAATALLVVAVLRLAMPASAYAAPPNDATSNAAARNQAIRAIPWNNLAEPYRRDVQYVVRNASVYRQLPTRVIDCDPDLFSFLLRHPDVVVDVWRLMGISRVSLERTSADTFRGTDGAGTTGHVAYAYADWQSNARNLAVIYADGAYDGKPFTTPLRARSVLVLHSVASQDAKGRTHVTVRIDSFVHIDQVGVELIAKTVQPWLNRIADQNFVETVSFVSTFSRTAERNPQGMERLAARLPSVDEPTRRELVQLCYQTAERYARLDRPQRTGPLVLARQSGPPAPAPQ